MKIFKTILVFICFATIISCGDATDESLGISGEGNLTAKVNGATFTSLKVAVGAQIASSAAVIQGSNAGGEYIRINITNYTGVGTYTFGNSISNVNSISYGTVNPVATWISTFNIGNGTVEITEDTASTITGKFSFTGINSDSGNSTKTVTDGNFSAPKK